MREPPALPATALPDALRAGYGLTTTAVTFLPLGYDSAAAVFRAEAADGRAYFVKLRRDGVSPAALAVPRWLSEQGLAAALAPLRTLAGGLWHPLEGHALIVYPFLENTHPLPSDTADAHWRQLGAALRQLHSAAPPPDLAALLPRETFTPVALDLVARLDALVATETFADPLSRAVAEAWRAHAAAIQALIAQVTDTSRRLRAAPPARPCVCHADPHWDNVLVDAAEQLWLVDWDETCLAVPERDLMFVIGGISADWATPADTARFMEGYGPAEVDPVALAYYRADWALQDISAYADDVLRQPALSAATRADAARLFHLQFAPGNMVAIALGSDWPHA